MCQSPEIVGQQSFVRPLEVNIGQDLQMHHGWLWDLIKDKDLRKKGEMHQWRWNKKYDLIAWVIKIIINSEYKEALEFRITKIRVSLQVTKSGIQIRQNLWKDLGSSVKDLLQRKNCFWRKLKKENVRKWKSDRIWIFFKGEDLTVRSLIEIFGKLYTL